MICWPICATEFKDAIVLLNKYFFLEKSWTNYMSTDFSNATWGRHKMASRLFDSAAKE